jgi:hypothetical protein
MNIGLEKETIVVEPLDAPSPKQTRQDGDMHFQPVR